MDGLEIGSPEDASRANLSIQDDRIPEWLDFISTTVADT
jgi:hypothetical protein